MGVQIPPSAPVFLGESAVCNWSTGPNTIYQESRGSLHLMESYTRIDQDTIDYRFAINHARTFTAPSTVVRPMTLITITSRCALGESGRARDQRRRWFLDRPLSLSLIPSNHCRESARRHVSVIKKAPQLVQVRRGFQQPCMVNPPVVWRPTPKISVTTSWTALRRPAWRRCSRGRDLCPGHAC